MCYKRYKIVYCTPSLYGYGVSIIITDGDDEPCFCPLSDKVKVVNPGIYYLIVCCN